MVIVTPSPQIKEEIKKHLTLVADLHAQTNSFLHIYRLPPEILATIFTYGARDHYYRESDHPGFRVPNWVNVSYVCRHWRDVALNCPTLWAYHFTASLCWTEELLARSKQAPLKVRVCFDSRRTVTPFWSGLVKKLFGHAERIQELHLCVPLNVLPSSQLSLRTPRLQVLSIEGPWITVSKRTFSINDQDIPPLRILKLIDCSLSWRMLDLSRLTTLFLCRPPTPRENIAEFLATLPRMPRLTVLHLDHAFAGAREFLSSGASDVSQKIDLPFLARLLVVAPLSTVVVLLSRVNIPFKTEVRLGFQMAGSSVEDCAQIPSILARRFNDLSSSGLPIRSLAIDYMPYQFILYTSEHDTCYPQVLLDHPQWDSGFPLMICIGMGPSITRSGWDHITSDICCSIPSMAVQDFCVIDPPFSQDFWKKMLSHFHGLREMNLREGNMPDIVSLLSLVADEQVETPKGPAISDCDSTVDHIYVPALEKLELYHITFAHEDSRIAHEKALFDALATRRALHPKLTMVACRVEGEDLDSEDDEDEDSDRRLYCPLLLTRTLSP